MFASYAYTMLQCPNSNLNNKINLDKLLLPRLLPILARYKGNLAIIFRKKIRNRILKYMHKIFNEAGKYSFFKKSEKGSI